MDSIILTPRLKLTLIKEVKSGSQELQWLHELFCDKEATWWSLHGQAKSIEDTEKFIRPILPTTLEGGKKAYRVVYAVHKVLDPTGSSTQDRNSQPADFIGIITLRSLESGGLPLPESLTLPAAAATTTLTIGIAYLFLPVAWGKGYATEAVGASMEACKRAKSFWEPWTKLYVRALVNEQNPASQRVMEKTGMKHTGMYQWTGKAVFLAGKWREWDDLRVYGRHLLE